MLPDDLVRGDLLQVEWADITEDPVGDPNKPTLAHRHSLGYFWAIQEIDGIRVLVTTTTMEADDEVETSGYCTYPIGTVVDVEVIKRKRRKRGRQGARRGGDPAGRDQGTRPPDDPANGA